MKNEIIWVWIVALDIDSYNYTPQKVNQVAAEKEGLVWSWYI